MTTTQADENSWTTFEKLLLMQSVYKHGDNWLAISRTMKQNPMVSHSADFFTQKNCSTEYNTLVDPLKNEAEIEDEHKKRSGEYVNDKQRMPWTAKLARQLYHERIVELKSFISSTEQTFRTLVNEIDEIKSGKWDSRFTEMIKEEQKKKELEKKSEVVSETSTVEIPKDSSDIISDVNVKIESPLVQPSAKVESVIPMDVDKNVTIIGNEIAFNEEPQIEIKPLKEVDPTSVTEDMEIDVVSSTLPSAEVKDVVQPQTPSTPLAEPSENLVIDSSKEPDSQTEITVAAGLLKDDIELPVEGDVNMMDIDEEKTTEKPKSTSSSTLALESTSSTSETDASKAEQAKKTPSAESIIAEDTPQTMIGDVAMDVDELNGVEILQVDSESPERVHFTENLVTSPTSIEEVDTTVKQENIISKEQYEPKGQPSKITTEEEIDEVFTKGNEPESSEVVSIQPIENEETMIDIIKLESSSLSSSDEAKTDIKEDVSEKVKDDTGEEDSIMVDKSALPEESEEDKYSSKEKTTTPQAEFKEPSTSGSGLVPIVAVPNTPSNVRPETPGDHTAPTPTHQYDTAPTPSGETSDDKKLKTWQKLVSMILHEISNHRFASVFQNPIREQDAPGYYDIVKQPMDLKTLKKRLREGTFHDTNSFHRDLMLMFMNASVFNREETDIHQMALEMKDHVETQIMEFRKSEGSGGTHEPATRRKSMAIDAHEAAYFASDRRSEGDRSVVAGSSLRGKPKDDMADPRPSKKTKRLSVSLKKSERDV